VSDPEGTGDAALGEALPQGAQDQRLAFGRHGPALGAAGGSTPAAVAPAAGRPGAVSAELDEGGAAAVGMGEDYHILLFGTTRLNL